MTATSVTSFPISRTSMQGRRLRLTGESTRSSRWTTSRSSSSKPPSAKTDVSSASGLASVVFSVRLHGMQREVNELFGSYEPNLLLLQLAHPRMDSLLCSFVLAWASQKHNANMNKKIALVAVVVVVNLRVNSASMLVRNPNPHPNPDKSQFRNESILVISSRCTTAVLPSGHKLPEGPANCCCEERLQ
jgi:hypothetical protein